MLLILIYFPLQLIEPHPSSFLQLICGNLNYLSIYHMHHIEDLLTLFHNVFRILSSIRTSEDWGIHPQESPNPQTSRPFLSRSPLLFDLVNHCLAQNSNSLVKINIGDFPLRLHVRCVRYLWIFDIPSYRSTYDYSSCRHDDLKHTL